MPSSNTITSSDFNIFVAGTSAKSAEVNTNFSMWRGHHIPMDTATIASKNNSYDLGASDAYWRTLYTGSIDLKGSTSTTNFTIVPNTSSTSGAVDFKIGSQTVASYNTGGIISRFNPTFSGAINDTNTALFSVTPNYVLNSTVTVVTYGNPVLICLTPVLPSELTSSASTTTGVAVCATISGSSLIDVGVELRFFRNTTTSVLCGFHPQSLQLTLTGGYARVHSWPGSTFWFIDNSAPAGTNTYFISSNKLTNNSIAQISNIRLMVAEIRL